MKEKTTVTDADTDWKLGALAVQAHEAHKKLHDCIVLVQGLRDSLLAVIDELPGDREYKWELQADLGHALTGIYAASTKAATVARLARAGVPD
jgi:hypothetical protein